MGNIPPSPQLGPMIQPAKLTGDEDSTPPEDPIVIPDHTLFEIIRQKIAEAEVKLVGESGEIVLPGGCSSNSCCP